LTKNKEELKISFKEFQKILLDHHIKSKDRYLKNFVMLFKKFDTDNNGIIDENEFINILGSTNVYGDQLEEQTYRLLSIIDPNNNKQITFSECVSLFSQVFL
jgi:Ca2+-binding EF-hand superfamily protein